MTGPEPVRIGPTARRASVATILLRAASWAMLAEALVVLIEGSVADVFRAAVVSGAIFLASIVAFLAWLSRSVDHAAAMGSPPPPHSPRGAILWWFVPFANVLVPYRVVADLAWRAGVDRRRVGAWWTLWLLSIVAGGIVGRLSLDDPAAPTVVAVAVAGSAARAVSGFILADLVSRFEAAAEAASLAVGRDSVPDVAEAQPELGSTPMLVAEYCSECDRIHLTNGRYCAGCGFDYAAVWFR